uniref:Probable integral membrane protein n=1 Tax=Campylobacter lari TaxID=201 RepID=C5NP07_CAMLA|nr:probable integral membrane protein [Campylobacter lari]
MDKLCQKRDVFYIAGYDPRGYRHYYTMFKKNLAAQNVLLKYDYTLSKSQVKDNAYPFWEIQTPHTHTHYTFLSWNDIVKKNWSEGIKDALSDCYSFFRIYTITGLFLKFGKESPHQLITGYYPFFYVLLSLIFTLVCAFGSLFYLQNFHTVLGILVFILSLVFLPKMLYKLGKKLAVFWIARICSFCANWEKNSQGELELRMDDFARVIFEKLKENANDKNYELILSTHSVGTVLCINVLAKVLRKCEDENISFENLKVLTLGECIPLVSYQKKSFEFRKDLEYLGSKNLIWYDFTSIIDGACFAQVDFIRTSGVKAQFGPKYLSAKFHTLYKSIDYKKIKKDKYKAHFLYLFATQIQGVYNFFEFIIGKNKLEEKIK